jgi:hypothetical protein
MESSASTWFKIKWNTINLHYKHFRELIVQQSFEKNSRDFGVFGLDERFFGAQRVRVRAIVEQQERLRCLVC